MNIDKFTQKSIEAVNGCEKLAMEYGNQEIEQEHLLYSLLTLDDSLILKLVEKMEIQKDHFVNRAKQALEKRVKVQGGQPYVGQYLNKVLVSASDEAKQMGDEYVSVEHLFLAMIKNPNKEIAEIWKEYGITRERFLQALSTVRGNQRVTSDNPEATYDTLEKYGQDLVEKARNQKLDPVIGRDSEIRNVVRILSRKTKNNPVLIGEPGVGKTAVVEGVEYLTGAPIQASDLRAGAALVIAALAAKGRSEITQVHYIERGYEDIVSKLQALGADIQSVEEPDINLEANVG